MKSLFCCQCETPVAEKRSRWRVIDRRCNYSAFNGYRWTPSDYSCLVCLECGHVWRTKAAYVYSLNDVTKDELAYSRR